MRISEAVRAAFRAQGRRGGRARARRLAPAARRRIASAGAVARWNRVRFGKERFEEMGLPGGDLVDKGIADLGAWISGESKKLSREALLVALAAPRLRREGVSIPRGADGIADPDIRLYREIEREDGDAAHSRFNALRRRVVSFGEALAATRR